MHMVQLALRLAAIFLGATSCVVLARSGFDISLGPFLEDLIGGWDRIIQSTVGWIAVLALRGLDALSEYFNWHWRLSLHEQWRHIYVVLQLYFLRDATHLGNLGLKKNMWTSYVTGFLVATISAFFAGLIAPWTGSYSENLLIGLIPIVGFFVYALVMAFAAAQWNRQWIATREGVPVQPFGRFFAHRAKLAVFRGAVGAAIIAIGLLFTSTRSPAVLLLAIAWVALALEWLRRGWGQAKAQVANLKMSWRDALLKTGNINLGLDMLATVGLAVILVKLGSVAP